MTGPPSPLIAASATHTFLDFASKFVDNAAKVSNNVESPSQEQKELEREAEKLREVDASHDPPNSQPRRKSIVEHVQTESEQGIQKVYERCRALADRLVEGKDGKKPVKLHERRRSDVDKQKKDVETLRSEAATHLQKLLCKSKQVNTRI